MEKPREPMTYTRALNILHLPAVFTEEQLKKAYRCLARKYHPDNYEKAPEHERLAAEEKMKEVNEAHDYLHKLQNGPRVSYNRQPVYQNTSPDILFYKKDVRANMRAYFENTKVDDKKLISDVEGVFKTYESLFNSASDKAQVDSIFNRFLAGVKAVYESYQAEYYRKNGIDNADVKVILNYNSSIDNFYKQLCNIKEKYSKKALFEKMLEDECEKYQLYHGYNARIASSINMAQGEVRAVVNEIGYSDKKISRLISSMHSKIEKSFSDQTKHNKIVADLLSEVYAIDDDEIKDAYTELVVLNEAARGFHIIREHIRIVRNLINAYNKKQAFIEQNRNQLDAMYMEVTNNFKIVMDEYSKTFDFESMRKAIDVYKRFILFYHFIEDQKLDKSVISLLDKLTMTDFENDENIMDIITQILNGRILIEVTEDYGRDIDRFKVLLFENGKYFISSIESTGKKIEPIDYNDINKYYVTIDDFIDNAKFNGVEGLNAYSRPLTILYYYGDYMLYIAPNGELDISRACSLKNCQDSLNAEIYRDKGFMKSELTNMVKEINDDVRMTSDEELVNSYHELINASGSKKQAGRMRYAFGVLSKIFKGYQKKQELDSEPVLSDETYDEITNRFIQAMDEYNVSLDFRKMKKAIELYHEFIFCCYLIQKQKKNISDVPLLAKLSFKDMEVDRDILSMVCLKFLGRENQIYININSSPFVNVLSYDDARGVYSMTGIDEDGVKYSQDVTYSEIAEHYMSLDEFVNQSAYVARYGYEDGVTYVILFTLKDCAVCLDEKGKVIVRNHVPLKNFITAVEASPYNDKELMKLAIARMVQEDLFNYNESSGSKSNKHKF